MARRTAPKATAHRLRGFAVAAEGAVATLFALLLAMLAGVVALSIEMGRAWTVQTELQAAADAAALAGATQLDLEAGAMDRARAAAKSAFARNTQTYANDGQGDDVTIEDADIRFLESLDGTIATSDADAEFIEVTTGPRQVNFALALFAGAPGMARPTGRAVAGLGLAMCRTQPMFICQPPGGLPDLDPGKGVWLKGKNNGDSSGWAPGNFGLLALQQYNGSSSLSANDVRDALGRENPLAECFSPDGTVQTKPGQTTSIASGLNMRFDIYPNGTHQVPAGEAEVMLNPEYRPSANTVKGMIRDGTQCSLASGGGSGWKKPSETFDGPGEHPDLAANPIDAMGFPRDSCAYPNTAANPTGGSCVPSSTTGAAGQYGDGNWDADTYLRVNHPGWGEAGVTAAADDPDNGYGNGDGELSRYETHQWELQNAIVPNDPPNGERGDTVNDPICYGGGFPAVPTAKDRRVVTVAVVDCSGLSGTTEVEPEAFYNLFLTEPVGVFGDPPDNNSIYAEIVGPANAGQFGAEIARRIVQLYE